jgi:hypothetical protein
MSDKRKHLREKIEAAEARHQAREEAERAAGPADRVTSFAREHPLLLIAGGLAVGIALSTLIPRSPTRKLSKKTAAFLATVAELGLAYGREAMEAAEEAGRQGKDKLAELSSTAKDKAGDQLERVSALIGRD